MSNRLVFFGDSITASGKSESLPLGDGYVSMLVDRFSQHTSFSNSIIINSGINGNTVQDLLIRYKQDVVDYSPQVLLIKIGINDAYNDFISGINDVNLSRFRLDYTTLINQLQKNLPDTQILLLSPYFIADNPHEPLYQKMAGYINVVINLGIDFKFPFLNTQLIFDEAVQIHEASFWAEDQVHPVKAGHELLAGRVYDFILKNSDFKSFKS